MPGLQARNPCSEHGYEVRSKFRGLLSGLCNNSINQTGWLLPLMFYKREFSTFYCNVSCITSRLRLTGRKLCGVTFYMPNLDVMFGIWVLPPKLWRGAFFSLHSLFVTNNWTPRRWATDPQKRAEKQVRWSSSECFDTLVLICGEWYKLLINTLLTVKY